MWRRVAIGVAAVLAVVIVVGSVTLFTVSRRALPDHAGEFRIDGLTAEVQVKRDDLGVPQIYAATTHDLFLTQGYVHAQDRFFEMDFRRHLTAGRLSELVGEAGLEADRMIRTLGWRHVAEQEWPLLSQETRTYLQAYADGVNAYIASREPGQLALEYTVLGMQVEVTDVEPWTPVDSLAWLKAMAWDLLGNYSDELGRAALYGQAIGYGADVALEMVEAAYPAYPTDRNLPIVTTPELLEANAAAEEAEAAALSTTSTSDETSGGPQPDAAVLSGLADVQAALDAVPNLLGDGEGIGSNSWVVSGEHTESGLPLLANDPHLGISAPGIWYQNGLHCTTVGSECPFEVAGFSFAGLPGVVIGHNAELGWGFTNMGSDAVDLFLERVYPDGTYLYDGERQPLTERREVISVNGGESETIVVRTTGHGPIISDVLASSRVAADRPSTEDQPPAGVSGFSVAMQWTALTPGRTADAIFLLGTASDAADVATAAAAFEVPTQNIVFATTDGTIGYQAPGKIPIREAVPDGVVPSDGSWPRPGWDSRYDWQGFVDPTEMPQVLNPDEGFIVAANQAVQAPGTDPFLTTDYDFGYRSQAIRDVLEARIADGGGLTVADMNEIQLIDTNPYAELLVPVLLEVDIQEEAQTPEVVAFTEQAVDLLEDWDHANDTDSAAAAYFSAVWANVMRLTFWDQVPTSQRPDGGSQWLEAVRGLLEDVESPWWDDRATLTVVEQRDQILAQALIAARSQLTVLLGKAPQDWRWGQLHQAAPQHQALGSEGVPTIIRNLVNPDPIGVAGGSSIVNANGWNAASWEEVDGELTYPVFDVTAVPAMRMVLDVADWDASTWVQLTGNSGHPLSQNYADQFGPWAEGETFPWAFTPDAVEDAEEQTLVLLPPG
ncbi:penicillin acylase family protein [Pseudactinotalea suaedae]